MKFNFQRLWKGSFNYFNTRRRNFLNIDIQQHENEIINKIIKTLLVYSTRGLSFFNENFNWLIIVKFDK